MYSVIAVNPGSTSTKLALFADEQQSCSQIIEHQPDEFEECESVWDQLELRWKAVRKWSCAKVSRASAVASAGGLLRPLSGGVYAVNQRMIDDARAGLQGQHASNLGCALAQRLAALYSCPAYVVDPVSVDEFEPLARYSGHPAIQRRSLSHALNLHAAARRAADEISKPLEQTNVVVAHLGGGISVAPLRGGRIIDVNDASSDGPFSPERTGGLPLQPLIELCFSGRFNREQMQKLVMGRGGLAAYLGTNSAREVERRIARGDDEAREIYESMAYQIAKEIGAMAAVLGGKIDAIVLTGGLSGSALLMQWIRSRVSWIAPVLVFDCPDEMKALASAVLRVVRGVDVAFEY